jgi:hypothetical protein
MDVNLRWILAINRDYYFQVILVAPPVDWSRSMAMKIMLSTGIQVILVAPVVDWRRAMTNLKILLTPGIANKKTPQRNAFQDEDDCPLLLTIALSTKSMI